MNYVIGIAGNINSGKDTVASMINYIFAVGIAKAKYADWLVKRKSIDYTYADRIIHFADGLKQVLSIIYGIPLKYFYDRTYKDEKYYNLSTRTFISIDAKLNPTKSIIININDLEKYSLNYYIDINRDKSVLITIRTLMQYFGTDICRTNLEDDIWIRCGLNKIIDTATSRKLCIIPDVRFHNEADAIKNCDSFPLYGGLIKINRNDSNRSSHSSEMIDFNYDFEIDNNGTLTQLFFKVLDICQQIILQ